MIHLGIWLFSAWVIVLTGLLALALGLSILGFLVRGAVREWRASSKLARGAFAALALFLVGGRVVNHLQPRAEPQPEAINYCGPDFHGDLWDAVAKGCIPPK